MGLFLCAFCSSSFVNALVSYVQTLQLHPRFLPLFSRDFHYGDCCNNACGDARGDIQPFRGYQNDAHGYRNVEDCYRRGVGGIPRDFDSYDYVDLFLGVLQP